MEVVVVVLAATSESCEVEIVEVRGGETGEEVCGYEGCEEVVRLAVPVTSYSRSRIPLFRKEWLWL